MFTLPKTFVTRIPQMDARFFTRRSVIYSIIQ